jgi:YggT family protein
MGVLVQTLIGAFLVILWLLVLGHILVGWVDPRRAASASRFLFQTTEPLIAPVRRVVPPTGMLDVSSLVVLLVLGALSRAVL